MFRFLINAISNAFSFSKTESRGALFLIFLCIAIFLLSNLISNQLKSKSASIESDSLAIAEWKAEIENSIKLKAQKEESSNKRFEYAHKENLSNNLSDKSIGSTAKIEEKDTDKEERPIVVIKDLNTASAEELRNIRGIGPVLSERIVKFRNRLGGFYSSEQLNEVYGLDSVVIARLKDEFQIKSPIQLVNLNTDSLKFLYQHPYISYDLAKNILAYRKQHGDLGIEDFKKLKSVPDSILTKIIPYLE